MFTHFSLTTWLLTIAALVVVVVVDMVVIARRKRAVTLRDSVLWVALYVTLAAIFAILLFAFAPGSAGGQFVAGYVTEYVLSVDNLLVFVIIMSRFAVPLLAQDKALYVGIVGSMCLRAVFIIIGAGALALASWVFYIFGAALLYTAVRLMIDRGEEADIGESAIVRGVARVVPTTRDYHGIRVFARVDRRWMATPLLIVIVSISIANVVFALDSLPAIFGLTQDAYLVVTANAFALMGLRQLFFVVGGLLDRLTYLNFGLGAILAFIAVKLILEALRDSNVDSIGSVHLPRIGISASLVFIVSALAVTAAASLAANQLRRRRAADGAHIER